MNSTLEAHSPDLRQLHRTSGLFYAGECSETMVLSSESAYKGAHVPPFPEIPHHTDLGCHPHRSRQASERYDRSDRSPLETSPDTNGHPNTDCSLFGRQRLVKIGLPGTAESCPPLRYKRPTRRPSVLSSGLNSPTSSPLFSPELRSPALHHCLDWLWCTLPQGALARVTMCRPPSPTSSIVLRRRAVADTSSVRCT